jgi:excisionase family DNA binding protein
MSQERNLETVLENQKGLDAKTKNGIEAFFFILEDTVNGTQTQEMINPLANLVTAEELAAMLKVSRAWLYRLAREGKIPCLKLSTCVRFKLDEVAVWTEKNRDQQ